MQKLKVFLSSSMGGELNEERTAIKVHFSADNKLNSLFELYAIDGHASPHSIQKAYTDEVIDSKILICLLGNELREAVVNEFTIAESKGIRILCYIKKNISPSPEMQRFIDERAYKVHCGSYYQSTELVKNIESDILDDVVRSYIREIDTEKNETNTNYITGIATYPQNEYRFYPIDQLIKVSKVETIARLDKDQLITFAIVLEEQYGDYKTALLLLEVALIRYPNDWMLHNNRGTILEAMGLSEASVFSYKKVPSVQSGIRYCNVQYC